MPLTHRPSKTTLEALELSKSFKRYNTAPLATVGSGEEPKRVVMVAGDTNGVWLVVILRQRTIGELGPFLRLEASWTPWSEAAWVLGTLLVSYPLILRVLTPGKGQRRLR